MTSPKTVTPDQPQAAPDDVLVLAREALAAQFECSVKAFPYHPHRTRGGLMDHTYEIKAIIRAILAERVARPVLPVETPAEGLREALAEAQAENERWRLFLEPVDDFYQEAFGALLAAGAYEGVELKEGEYGKDYREASDNVLAGIKALIASTTPAPLSGKAFAAIDVTSLQERHIAELRVHADKLRWQMENDERPAPPHGWTCFHCAQTFTTWASASAHFGDDPLRGRPTCQADLRTTVQDAVAIWADGPCDNATELVEALVSALASTAPAPLSGGDGSLREAAIRADEREACARIADKGAMDAAASADRKQASSASGASVLTGYIFAKTEAEGIAKSIRARAALATVPPETAEMEGECNHDWVDATNRVVSNGKLCLKCGALAAATDEELAALNADRLAARASSSGEAGDE